MKKNSISAILGLTEDEKALHPLTKERPIASLPFASRYRIIDFNLSSISHAGIDSVAIFIAGSGRSVYDHIRSGAAWGLESSIRGGIFTYSQMSMKMQRELSEADYDYYNNHRTFLERSKSEYVFIAGSKIIANVDIQAVRQHHIQKGGDITMIYKSVPKEAAAAHQDDSVLKVRPDEFLENISPVAETDLTGEERVPLGMGMFLIECRKLLAIIQRADDEGLYIDCGKLIEHYLDEYKVNTYEYTGYMADVDSIESYYQANMDILDKNKFNNLFNGSQFVITKVKNGAPTYYHKDAAVSNAMFATDSVISGTVKNSVIYRNVVIEKGAAVENSIVLQGSKIGEGAVLEYCILDKSVTIGPGVILRGSRDNIVVVEKGKTITL